MRQNMTSARVAKEFLHFPFTLNALMDSSFWFDIINLGWSIVYIERSQVVISK